MLRSVDPGHAAVTDAWADDVRTEPRAFGKDLGCVGRRYGRRRIIKLG
jgi:hypothetical protein